MGDTKPELSSREKAQKAQNMRVFALDASIGAWFFRI
jgi:hypothetical protein